MAKAKHFGEYGRAREPVRVVTTGGLWSVYILRCADGSLYTGVARDLARRLRQHNGELVGGAQYTRGRRPVTVIWVENCDDRSCAQIREAEIKRLSRADKLSLVRSSPQALPAG